MVLDSVKQIAIGMADRADGAIAGQPIEVPTANGVQVPGPVDRTSYVPQAPLP